MPKWVNCELSQKEAEAFSAFLKKHGFKYEASSCYNLVHFEIFLNKEEVAICQEFLDTL